LALISLEKWFVMRMTQAQKDAMKTPPWFNGLRKHLTIVLVLKALLMLALWQMFVKPFEASVDAKTMANLLSASPNTAQIRNIK
jgi:hypothetical protein